MTTPYDRGRAFEYRAMERLEEMGAVFVTRSAGSHTPVDIIAFWKPRNGPHKDFNKPHFIQAKSGKTPISRRDRHTLIELAEKCGAVPVVVTRGLKFETIGRRDGDDQGQAEDSSGGSTTVDSETLGSA